MSAITQPTVKTLSPREASDLFQKGDLVLLDVRSGVEHAEVHAVGAVHIPLDQFDAADVLRRYPGKTIACICKAGTRGGKAAQMLADAGCGNVINVAGGTDAWALAGLPVERNSTVIPLQRQVMIVAGSCVLAGTLLGYFVHPAFLILSGFFGAGLTFAGLSGFCGLALVLAKMPWNRKFNHCGGASCAV